MGELVYSGLVYLAVKLIFWVVFLPIALIFIGYLIFIIVESVREWRNGKR